MNRVISESTAIEKENVELKHKSNNSKNIKQLNFLGKEMAYRKTKENKFMVRERQHDPIVEAILGENIKYASENFKKLEKSIQEMKRIIRNM